MYTFFLHHDSQLLREEPFVLFPNFSYKIHNIIKKLMVQLCSVTVHLSTAQSRIAHTLKHPSIKDFSEGKLLITIYSPFYFV